MKIYKPLILDLSKKNYNNTIGANQFDTKSRFIDINLVNEGLPLDITGHTVKVYCRKPDKTKVFNDVNVIDVITGKVRVELTNQILAKVGIVECELTLYGADESIIASQKFYINVDETLRDDSAIESQNEFTALANALTQVNSWDTQFEQKYAGLETEYADRLTQTSNKIGDLTTLQTTKKDDTVNAINEVNSQLADITSINVNKFSTLIIPTVDNYNINVDTLIAEMTARNYKAKLSYFGGTYFINKPLPYYCAIEGLGNQATIIKASADFVGNMMIDFNVPALERKYMKGVRFSASYKTIQIFGSSGDANGSSQNLFEDIWFTDTPDGVYAVGGSATTTVSGMLVGSLFLRCTWDGCVQWANLGNIQDDVTFVNCRFAMNTPPSNYVMKLTGSNIKLVGCYFFFKNTNYIISSTYKMLIHIGQNIVSFDNCFLESQSIDATHIFHLADSKAALSLNNIQLNLAGSNSLVALCRKELSSASGDRNNLTIKSIAKFDIGTYKALDMYVASTATGKYLNFDFFGIDDLSALFQFDSNSNLITDLTLKVNGMYKGKSYSGGYSSKDGVNVIKSISSNGEYGVYTDEATNTSASGATPRSYTYTLPSSGVWLLTISAKVAGDKNFMANANYIATWYDGTFDTLGIDQIGTNKYSTGNTYGVNSLTVGAPNASGQIAINVGWTNGNSYATIFVVKARKLSDF